MAASMVLSFPITIWPMRQDIIGERLPLCSRPEEQAASSIDACVAILQSSKGLFVQFISLLVFRILVVVVYIELLLAADVVHPTTASLCSCESPPNCRDAGRLLWLQAAHTVGLLPADLPLIASNLRGCDIYTVSLPGAWCCVGVLTPTQSAVWVDVALCCVVLLAGRWQIPV